MKKLIIVMLGLLLAVSIAACKSKNSESDSVIYGNTAGNISNGGYAAIQGDWIYYGDMGLSSGLYKIKTDGTDWQRLSDDFASYINVVGDWIYYHRKDDDVIVGRTTLLYRIKTDGSDRQPVKISYR